MSDACCGKVNAIAMNGAARRILWVVLVANAAMFLVETVGGHAVGSLALQADALDFGADAATYAVTLWAIGRSEQMRARAALIKSATMCALGLFILASAVMKVLSASPPDAPPMGAIGALALAVNLGALVLLLRFRDGDANLRSAWLCSRNDAFGNVLVMAAAGVTALTRSPWPDVAVGLAMCLLFLSGSWSVYRQARRESAALAGPKRLKREVHIPWKRWIAALCVALTALVAFDQVSHAHNENIQLSHNVSNSISEPAESIAGDQDSSGDHKSPAPAQHCCIAHAQGMLAAPYLASLRQAMVGDKMQIQSAGASKHEPNGLMRPPRHSAIV